MEKQLLNVHLTWTVFTGDGQNDDEGMQETEMRRVYRNKTVEWVYSQIDKMVGDYHDGAIKSFSIGIVPGIPGPHTPIQ